LTHCLHQFDRDHVAHPAGGDQHPFRERRGILEPRRESFAHEQARPEQSGFDGRQREPEDFGCFLGAETFDVPQYKGLAVNRRQGADGIFDHHSYFLFAKQFFRVFVPLVASVRENLDFRFANLIERHGVLPGLAFLQRFIYGDSREPRGESGFAAELTDMPEGLNECVLHGFFGVFRITKDCDRDAKDPALVLPHQRFERTAVTGEYAFNEEEIVFRTISLCHPVRFKHINDRRELKTVVVNIRLVVLRKGFKQAARGTGPNAYARDMCASRGWLPGV